VEDDRVSRFWAVFVAATGGDGDHTAWGFGSDPGMATELGLLVRDGPKRATASLRSAYEDGEPLCVIRTTLVETRRFADVDEEFAWTEGEGDRSLAYWREAHIRFFTASGTPPEDDTEVVLERFDLLWPLPAGG